MKYIETIEMRHLRPGQHVVPLGGEAEKRMRENGGRPVPRDVLSVVSEPYARGLFGRIKKMEAPVMCSDNKTTLYLKASPYSDLAVVCA